MIRHILSVWGAATLVVTPTLFAEPVMAQDKGTGQLKSAIVYNILRFVDFPRDVVGKTLVVCSRRGAGGNLSALSGRSVGSRPISVRTIESSSDGDGCNVVYLGSASSADVTRVKQRGVLVIGDGSTFLKAGGTIGLVTTGKQTRFEVSMRAAKQADIKISSQLLRLASRVEQ